MLNGKLGIKDISVGSTWKINGGTSITVLEIINAKNIKVRHNDCFGYITNVQVSAISSGNIKNPYAISVYGKGYLGEGLYSTRINKVMTLEYMTWVNMLKRCYDPGYHMTHPTYEDCIVCNEWLNFQTFANWYCNTGYYGLGYEIDKDLLVRGNRIYSPTTCVMLPSEINAILSVKSNTNRELPVGVYPSGNNYQVKVHDASGGTYVGTYHSISLAIEAQHNAKKLLIYKLAEKHRPYIDEFTYNAIIAWISN